MYIKVAVEGLDPVIYRLSRAEVLIGSAHICHIIIPHRSISKKHLKIIRDEVTWYAVDQGSTNGSFYDDEQLVPGKRIDLSPDNQLMLGDKVLLTLVEIAQNVVELNNPTEVSVPVQNTISSDQDKTRVISLADLQKAKADVVKKKQREIKKNKIQEKRVKQKESQKISKLLLIIFATLLIGFIGSNWWMKNKNDFIKKETVVKKVSTKFKADDEIETDLEGFRIRRSSLLNRNVLIEYFNKFNECIQPEVRDFCVSGILTERGNGAQFIKPSNYVFFINEAKLLPLIYAQFYRDPQISVQLARKLAIFALLEVDFKEDQFPKESNIYIVLFYYDEMEAKRVSTISAFKASMMKQMYDVFQKKNLMNPESDLEAGIKAVETFYTLY